jgi:hypothetical protein
MRFQLRAMLGSQSSVSKEAKMVASVMIISVIAAALRAAADYSQRGLGRGFRPRSIGAYPNAGPHSPEIYIPRIIEEIVAAEPCAIALEAACRRLVRTCKFPPTVVEVLEALREANVPASDFDDRNKAEEDCYVVATHKELEKALAALLVEVAPA